MSNNTQLMNRLLNFAAVSDEVSKKNSYQNLLSFFDDNFKFSDSLLSNEFNQEKDEKAKKIIDALSDIFSDDFDFHTFYEQASKDDVENVEFLKLIKNYNSTHPIIEKIKYFIILKEQIEDDFDYNINHQIDSFRGALSPDIRSKRDSITILVEGEFPIKELPINTLEVEKLRSFFKEYPTLQTFYDFDSALDKSLHTMNDVYENFFIKARHMADLSNSEFDVLSTECINLTEMNKIVKDYITLEPSRGTLDHDESQPVVYFNTATLKISDIINISLELKKVNELSVSNDNLSKNKHKPY